MFEDLLLRDLEATSIVVALAGALAGLIIPQRQTRLLRAPYFALTGIIALLATLTQAVWLLWQPALAMGIPWAIIVAGLGALAAAGYALARIALSRSRDGFGHGAWGFLAFIPLINLHLLLKPSKQNIGDEAEERPSPFGTGEGVTIGFLTIAAAIFAGGLIEDQARVSWSPRAAAEQNEMDLILDANGLVQTLQTIAEGAEPPIKIDDNIEITAVTASGKTLRRAYSVDLAFFVLSEPVREQLVRTVCDDPRSFSLLRAGAIIESAFRLKDGIFVGRIAISLRDCS